jgi:hypothetical protein
MIVSRQHAAHVAWRSLPWILGQLRTISPPWPVGVPAGPCLIGLTTEAAGTGDYGRDERLKPLIWADFRSLAIIQGVPNGS